MIKGLLRDSKKSWTAKEPLAGPVCLKRHTISRSKKTLQSGSPIERIGITVHLFSKNLTGIHSFPRPGCFSLNEETAAGYENA
jgi:hypothetical protein